MRRSETLQSYWWCLLSWKYCGNYESGSRLKFATYQHSGGEWVCGSNEIPFPEGSSSSVKGNESSCTAEVELKRDAGDGKWRQTQSIRQEEEGLTQTSSAVTKRVRPRKSENPGLNDPATNGGGITGSGEDHGATNYNGGQRSSRKK